MCKWRGMQPRAWFSPQTCSVSVSPSSSQTGETDTLSHRHTHNHSWSIYLCPRSAWSIDYIRYSFIISLHSELTPTEWVLVYSRRSSLTAPSVWICPLTPWPSHAATVTARPASQITGTMKGGKMAPTAAQNAGRPSTLVPLSAGTPCWPKPWSSSAEEPSAPPGESPSRAHGAQRPLRRSVRAHGAKRHRKSCQVPRCPVTAAPSPERPWRRVWCAWHRSARLTWSLIMHRRSWRTTSWSRPPETWARRSAPSTSTCRSSSAAPVRCTCAGCAPATSTRATRASPHRLRETTSRWEPRHKFITTKPVIRVHFYYWSIIWKLNK